MPRPLERGFRFIATEVRSLQAAVYVLALSAILSSLLALLRDRLLAHYFGASTTLDIYYASFRIPDLLFVLGGALVSVYILIPELAKRSSEEKRRYIDTMVVGFSLFAICVSALAALLAPAILSSLFPHFLAQGHLPELVLLTRIMLLQPILLGLSNILAAITQSAHRYALYSLSPLLYNLGIIAGTIVLYPLFGIAGLALGVVAGAFLHLAIQLPSVIADGYLRVIPRVHRVNDLFETVAISVPRALALSMTQLTFLGLTTIAGGLSAGSIAVFMFAYNLQAVPLSVIGASYSVAAFPTLASALARGERDAFIAHVATAARYIAFWSMPAMALVIVLRAHIVRAVLGSGSFDWTDTRLTAAALAVLSIALFAQALMLLLVRAYYAAGRTFTPFFVNVAMTLATLGTAALILGWFGNQSVLSATQTLLRIEDLEGTRVLALALAYALVAVLGTLILALHFEWRFGGFVRKTARAWGESLVAALAAGEAAYAALQLFSPVTFSSTTLSVLAHGFAASVAGAIVAALAYRLLGSRELAETLLTLRGRIRPLGITVAAPAEEAGPTGPQ